MADQNDERKLDELLDSALSEYSAVEPRPGLEVRILAHVQEAEQPRARWWNVRWLMAGAVATAIAVLVLSIWLFRPMHKPIQEVQRDTVPLNQRRPRDNPQGIVREHNRQAKNAPVIHKQRRIEYPPQELAQRDRPSVFPTPTGLSEQEKLMLAYIAQTPKEEIIAEMRPPNPEEEEEFWKDRQPAAARPQR